ncbi:MAG: S9 family peptidase, partial [Xanthomonadales bacterium]|nr:S9 family peptidase [Xanthomonadales bacterium]
MPRPVLLLLLLLTMLIAPNVPAAEGGTPLTLDRLYADPALSGTPLRGLKLSPDGRYASFLRGRPEDQNQQDLWAYDVKTGKTARLVDSTALVAEETLSDEEKARRERLRITSLRGIV